jgi:predicted MPP superfamily phosphohydrolase
MKKIIHLSDLHIGYEKRTNNCTKKAEELVKKIKAKQKYKPASDFVIVVTGDIVQDADQRGGYPKASKLLKPLKDSFHRVLVVPGNHDYHSKRNKKIEKQYVPKFKKAFYGNTNGNRSRALELKS